MYKRGSHVGVVLSFVIFITFLVFLYSIIEPELRVQKDKESLLDYLKIELAEKVAANLTSITISINRTSAHECVILKDLIEEAVVTSHLIVKDELGNIANANISESDNTNLIIDRENKEKVFFKIYNSQELPELEQATIHPCTSLEKDAEFHGSPSGYSIPLVNKEIYIFEKKIIGLIKDYNGEGYEDLREEIKIPSGTEFGFSFTYNNGTTIETEEKGIPKDVQVREIPVQYVDKKANILLGYVNIKVW